VCGVVVALLAVDVPTLNFLSEVLFGKLPASIRPAVSLAHLVKLEGVDSEQPNIDSADYQIVSIFSDGTTIESLSACGPYA
jgi:hypothetical protein